MIITNLTDVDYWFGPMHLLPGSGTMLTLDDTSDTSLYLLNDEVADAVNTLYLASNITVSSAASPFPRPTGTPSLLHGDGSPEGMVYAPQGSLYMRRDSAGASTSLYTKTTGVTQNTGWVSVIAPTMECIAQVTVEAATATINFGSIPQIYAHLKLIGSLATVSATAPSLNMTVNGSSADYYNTEVISAVGSSISASTAPTSSAAVGTVPGSGYVGGTEITLMGYTSAAMVPFTAISGHQDSSGSVANYASGTMATSELGGAVTSIALSLLSLAGGVDFAVGSVATLYGLASNVVA
jgi:hypothetical protein